MLFFLTQLFIKFRSLPPIGTCWRQMVYSVVTEGITQWCSVSLRWWIQPFLLWLIYGVWRRQCLHFADLSVGSSLPLLCSSAYGSIYCRHQPDTRLEPVSDTFAVLFHKVPISIKQLLSKWPSAPPTNLPCFTFSKNQDRWPTVLAVLENNES